MLVMIPDIEPYAPFIHAIFDSLEQVPRPMPLRPGGPERASPVASDGDLPDILNRADWRLGPDFPI